MVRLGVEWYAIWNFAEMFQFQYGAIGSLWGYSFQFLKRSFNSSMVRLGGESLINNLIDKM